MKSVRCSLMLGLGLSVLCLSSSAQDRQTAPDLVRTVRSGAWSAAATWEDGKAPSAGCKVQIRSGHVVDYDVDSATVIRSLHIAGTLTFAADKDTRLDVGLIRIQAGETTDEEGFDCTAHFGPADTKAPLPALLVGTPERPIAAGHTGLIRLVHVEGLDEASCPAIVCCGGQMEFHGAPLNRTWVKLGAAAKAGDTMVVLDEPVTGWRAGDRILVTATTRQIKLKKTFTSPSLRGHGQTEERLIKAIDGASITLDEPLEFDHNCNGAYRGDVANLSRNVIVESADPTTARGHTMYHHGSRGSISYAEFRHLGKPGVLGRYSLHYHLVGDSMRGSSVIGASIWDSDNRWLTIHGTNYLVVRDCVGYRSQGHGFFMEDGTEVYNILDRNLAVQALTAQPLPKQVIPFDKNDGSGFWWANCLNSFTRNVAVECDEYGYFFQAAKTPDFDPALWVQQTDGEEQKVDIRTLPFVRFEDNEAHCQRRHAFNLGGGVPFGEPNVGGVGPDERHPLLIRNFRVWNSHWAIHPVSPSVMIDGLDVFHADYGVWRPVYMSHAYCGVTMTDVPNDRQYAFVNPAGPPNDDADFPGSLAPVDDLPPITVITHIRQMESGKLSVRGCTADNGKVVTVAVNNQPATALRPNFAEWEILISGVSPGELKLSAQAEDSAGNVEMSPHQRVVQVVR